MTSKSFSVVGLTKIHEHWGEDPSKFSVQLHVEVTSAGTAGGEAFQVTVLSPAQLADDMGTSAEPVELARGLLFMLDYDERIVIDRLQRLIRAAGAMTWEELRRNVSKYFDWID